MNRDRFGIIAGNGEMNNWRKRCLHWLVVREVSMKPEITIDVS